MAYSKISSICCIFYRIIKTANSSLAFIIQQPGKIKEYWNSSHLFWALVGCFLFITWSHPFIKKNLNYIFEYKIHLSHLSIHLEIQIFLRISLSSFTDKHTLSTFFLSITVSLYLNTAGSYGHRTWTELYIYNKHYHMISLFFTTRWQQTPSVTACDFALPQSHAVQMMQVSFFKAKSTNHPIESSVTSLSSNMFQNRLDDTYEV